MYRAIIIAASITILLAACGRPNGAVLFKTVGCTKCHVLNGIGIGRIDLSHEADTRTRGWVRDQITYPKSHREDTGMPSFAFLSSSEINALADYVIKGGK